MKSVIKAVIAVVVLAGIAGAAELNGDVRAVLSQVGGNNGVAFVPKSLPITDVEQNLTPNQLENELLKREVLIRELTWKQCSTVAERNVLNDVIYVLKREVKILNELGGHLPSAAQVQAILAQVDQLKAQKATLETMYSSLIAAYPSSQDAQKTEKIEALIMQMRELDNKIAYAEMFR